MFRTRKAAFVAAVVIAGGLLGAGRWLLPGGPAHAQPAGGTWRVPVGPGRALVVTVPEGWRVSVRRPVVGPPTVLVDPPKGRSFRFILTPLPAGPGAPAGDLRGFLRQIGARLAERSVEGRLVLEPVPGAEGAWFYRLTDPDPGDGFRHLAQGARRLDGLLVTFTFLSHVPDPPALGQALGVVATARAE